MPLRKGFNLMLNYEKASELVTMLSESVQKHMETVQRNHPSVPLRLQLKLARIYAMEERGLSTEEMMLMWEAYDLTSANH